MPKPFARVRRAVARFWRGLRVAGPGPAFAAGAALACFYLAYLQLHEAAVAAARQDADSAALNLLGGLALLYVVKAIVSVALDSALTDLRYARAQRVEKRAKALADGTMGGGELRALADAARKARDWEEAEALGDAARMVERRESGALRDAALADLKTTNRGAWEQFDRLSEGRVS